MTESVEQLPEFQKPPLNEVAIGVQFTSIPGYASVNAHGAWQLFKNDYPIVQEHPRIEPQFETFGGANQNPGIQFRVAPAASNRLWFLSPKQDQLVQFQPDRFFTNWRKGWSGEEYPRFENVSQLFKKNLTLLSQYSQSTFSHELDINQAEVLYVNLIPVESFGEIGDWLQHWNKAPASDLETVNTSFTEVIMNDENKPFARLNCGIQSVFNNAQGGKAFGITLTFRGKPETNSIQSAMDFIELGHQSIVKKFANITTQAAHSFWER